jgi:enoyl-CoA hydratase
VLTTEERDGVTVLRIEHGRVGALDVELLDALTEAVTASGTALVVTGSGACFSAGVDLRRILDGGPSYTDALLTALSRTYRTLFDHPRPTVAAVNGHAIAGGYILAAAADWVLMAEGPGRAGVTELLVGVPFPGIALELLRMRTGEAQARPLVTGGATFQAGQALARHLIDEAVAADDLASLSLAAARRLAALGPGFRLTKRQLRLLPLARAQELAVLDADVDAVWQAPATLDRIRSYMASPKPPGG